MKRLPLFRAEARAVRSGAKTGRSPRDKRIVDHPARASDIWWGPVNIKLAKIIFIINASASHRLSEHAQDGCTSSMASPAGTRGDRLKIRVICARPYHALFMHNMLHPADGRGAGRVRRARLRDLQRRPIPCRSAHARQMTSTTSVDLSFERRRIHVILGTEYAGEMKKGRLHAHALPDAQAGRAVDALLGQRGA